MIQFTLSAGKGNKLMVKTIGRQKMQVHQPIKAVCGEKLGRGSVAGQISLR